MTALGVISAIEHMVPLLREHGKFPQGESFSIGVQGLGNVGYNILIGLLFKAPLHSIVATDISESAVSHANRHIKGRKDFLKIVQTDAENSNDVLNCGADIIIPCALG